MAEYNENRKFSGKPGLYNADEVDAYLDLVEQEFSRVVEEKDDLKTALADRDLVIARLRARLGDTDAN